MTTYRFHIKKYYYYSEDGSGPNSNRAYWLDNGAGFWYNPYSFDNTEQMFMWYPRISGYFGNSTFIDFSTNRGLIHLSLLGEFRISTPTQIFGDGNKNQYNFGDCNVTSPGSIYVRYSGATPTDKSQIILANSQWETAYVPSEFNIFKSEITTDIAKVLKSTLNASPGDFDPLSTYLDWNIYFYMNQIPNFGSFHFVVFYPGNDPNADEIIEVTP